MCKIPALQTLRETELLWEILIKHRNEMSIKSLNTKFSTTLLYNGITFWWLLFFPRLTINILTSQNLLSRISWTSNEGSARIFQQKLQWTLQREFPDFIPYKHSQVCLFDRVPMATFSFHHRLDGTKQKDILTKFNHNHILRSGSNTACKICQKDTHRSSVLRVKSPKSSCG